jgi:hypothetical protein
MSLTPPKVDSVDVSGLDAVCVNVPDETTEGLEQSVIPLERVGLETSLGMPQKDGDDLFASVPLGHNLGATVVECEALAVGFLAIGFTLAKMDLPAVQLNVPSIPLGAKPRLRRPGHRCLSLVGRGRVELPTHGFSVL